jgi:DNA ligase (NAD+)
MRNGSEQVVTMPVACPVCRHTLIREEGEAITRCPNSHCPSQRLRSLIHFTSKAGLDIEGLGKKAMEQLFNAHIIQDLPDIYTLTMADLEDLEGWGKKSANNAIVAIEVSKKTNLSKFIAALGIRYVGEVTSRLLEDHFHTLDRLMHCSYEDFIAIEGIGEQVAGSLRDYFADQKTRDMLTQLIQYGFEFTENATTHGDLPLSGMVFLFTGGLNSYSRSEAKERIKELGGQVSSSLTKKVTHLVCGEKPGSKLKKAQEMSITILSEQQFMDLIRS